MKDATVQGSNAPTSIANGIHHLDRSEDVDAIIVGRGGGSDSNLQAFNTERVAQALFTANTPVVTAIGHTDDQLIADQVADVATTARRAPTVGHGVLRTVTWRDGDPINDEYVRGEFDALKAIVGDFLDRGVFASNGEALPYLERVFREWSVDTEIVVTLRELR